LLFIIAAIQNRVWKQGLIGKGKGNQSEIKSALLLFSAALLLWFSI